MALYEDFSIMDYYIAILIPIIGFGFFGIYRVNQAYHMILDEIRAGAGNPVYLDAKNLLFRAHMFLIASTFLAMVMAVVRVIEIMPK